MTGFKKTKAYSYSEKIVLCRLISKYKSKIENKNNDAESLAEKKKNWEMLANEFNSFPSHTKRTVTQLKKLWENIMYRKKLEMARGKIRTTRVNTSISNDLDSTDTLTDHEHPQPHFLISEQDNAEEEEPEEKPIAPISVVKSEFQMMEEDHINTSNQSSEYEKQLQMLKVKEQELKVTLVEETIKNNRIIFELKKRKLELELQNLLKE